MNSLNILQLKQVGIQLQEYLSQARLQSVLFSEKYLWLEFYQKGPVWLGISIQVARPTVGILFEELRRPKKILKRPVSLFLAAHAVGQRLTRLELDEIHGRVLNLYFGPQEHQLRLELRLIPHAFNIVAYWQDKRVALGPIKDLLPAPEYQVKESSTFDVDAYFDQWKQTIFAEHKKVDKSKEIDPEFRRLQLLNKKQLGLSRLQQDLAQTETIPWERVGEHLKQQQQLSLPEEWEPLIDSRLSFSENLQMVFQKHKEATEKRAALLERIHLLQIEIQALESGELPEYGKKPEPPRSVASELLKKAKATGRKLPLREDLEAVIGKSAKDNLAILRQAQAWDLWVHLKDLPGSHAVVRRSKKTMVTSQEILQVGLWVLEQSLGSKRKPMPGDRYDLIYTECRFVKPIKGDKLGRVTYANAQTLTLKV